MRGGDEACRGDGALERVKTKYSKAERGDRAVRSEAWLRAEETRLAEVTERLHSFIGKRKGKVIALL